LETGALYTKGEKGSDQENNSPLRRSELKQWERKCRKPNKAVL